MTLVYANESVLLVLIYAMIYIYARMFSYIIVVGL